MITAIQNEGPIDRAWIIYDETTVDGETVREQVFAFNAPSAWTEDDVLANWERVRDEAEGNLSPEAQEAEAGRLLRAERDRRLTACDWTQLPDAPVDQAAWATYRQALRDLPENTADPENPVWPIEPE